MQDQEEPRWDDVRIFLAAHRHRSLGAAAKQLGLDTSTLSRRLAAFEASLGARLFDRSREGLTPTLGAERVLAAAEAMQAAHARLTRDASDIEVAAEGVVRLSVAPGMAERFIAPLLPRFRARHPRIAVELDASTRAIDLTRQEADLALRSIAPKGAELVVTKLGSGRWVPAGAPALLRTIGAVSSWSAVAWIAWDRDMTRLAPARWLAKHAPQAPIALRTSHFGSQIAAAEHGLALVMVPEPYLHGRALAAVQPASRLQPSIDDLPTDHLWLVVHRALRDVPRVSALWTFLAAEMRRLVA